VSQAHVQIMAPSVADEPVLVCAQATPTS